MAGGGGEKDEGEEVRTPCEIEMEGEAKGKSGESGKPKILWTSGRSGESGKGNERVDYESKKRSGESGNLGRNIRKRRRRGRRKNQRADREESRRRIYQQIRREMQMHGRIDDKGKSISEQIEELADKFSTSILEPAKTEEEEEEENEKEEEKTDKEEVAPRIDFKLNQFSKQIDELCDEMQEMGSFMHFNDLLDSISKLKSISEQIKSATEMEELKSISYEGKPATEMEEKTEEEMDGGKFSTEEEEEHERSGREKVEGEAVMGGGKSATETKEEEEARRWEEEIFASYRSGWESRWGNNGDSFEDLTLLSPMHFTHCTPGCIPLQAVIASTLQISSIKVAEIKKDFEWPLEVYGMVAVRDAVDNYRNPLFLLQRDDCQILTQEDPFLHLTGPCRAIVYEDLVHIEIQLIVKGITKSEDRALISKFFCYKEDWDDSLRTRLVNNYFCTVELCSEQVQRSVQATILGVRVVERGSSPFEYGGRVVCSSLPRGSIIDAVEPPSMQVLLLDSKDGTMPMGKHGYLDLSRHVVSVDLGGMLQVLIQAFSPSGDITGHVLFTPKKYKISQDICDLGDSKVEITVAWSLLVENQEDILLSGYVDPFAGCPPMPPSILKLFEDGTC